jgi:hypothetical protein
MPALTSVLLEDVTADWSLQHGVEIREAEAWALKSLSE